MSLLKLLEFLWCLQKVLEFVTYMAIKLYCEEVPHEGDKISYKIAELTENGTGEKGALSLAFYKHLLICVQFSSPIFYRKFEPL
jgi:hypothetical protein